MTERYPASIELSVEYVHRLAAAGEVDEALDKPVRGRHKGSFGCRAGRNTISVDTQGRLHACSKLLPQRGFEPDHILGSVWDGITEPQERRVVIDTTERYRPACAKCDLKDDCTGGCPAVNYEMTGCMFTPDPTTCAWTRSGLELRERLRELADARAGSR
jgi:uncharacterized protein